MICKYFTHSATHDNAFIKIFWVAGILHVLCSLHSKRIILCGLNLIVLSLYTALILWSQSCKQRVLIPKVIFKCFQSYTHFVTIPSQLRMSVPAPFLSLSLSVSHTRSSWSCSFCSQAQRQTCVCYPFVQWMCNQHKWSTTYIVFLNPSYFLAGRSRRVVQSYPKMFELVMAWDRIAKRTR